MTALTEDTQPSWGAYEKQVILELDIELSVTHKLRMNRIDPRGTYMLDTIEYCYNCNETVDFCKQLIMEAHGLPALASVSKDGADAE